MFYLFKLIQFALLVLMLIKVSISSNIHARFIRRGLPDLNLPASEQEDHSIGNDSSQQPHTNIPISSPGKGKSSPIYGNRTVLKEEKNKTQYKRNKSNTEWSKYYLSYYSPKGYEDAKSTMSTKDFNIYQTKHYTYWKNRKGHEKRTGIERKESTKRVKEGNPTEKDLDWKQREKAKNKTQSERRKRLGILTPSRMKRKAAAEERRKQRTARLTNTKKD